VGRVGPTSDRIGSHLRDSFIVAEVDHFRGVFAGLLAKGGGAERGFSLVNLWCVAGETLVR
jgi:hypothetical protein